MTTFGLITEGITDQFVIENILIGYFNQDEDNIEFKELQPLRDEIDENRARNYGGWGKVIEYCASNEFKEALPFCNYLIIQIDTDVSDKPDGYRISHYDETGKELTPIELIEKVIKKLTDSIGESLYEKNQDKIIFAISVHSTECWLLPLYYQDNKKYKVINCLGTLNQELQKKEKFTIDAKNPEYYEIVSRKYCKHKILMKCYKENPSLKIFIEEVEKRNIVIDEDDF
ncbi:hypothetical protein BGP_3840 [Beggiatoa sp. PS]|nr:hypothetical protein BGP_3840 [Beggiatoa sp. PS]